MVKELLEKKEKKVEYIELIYDLIFVYIIGRNNALLHHTENGFVQPAAFIAYVICTLAVIQIWNYTTYYVNAYGRNSIRDHVSLFINMFLMYFIAEGTRSDWQDLHYMQYHIAWALILLNIGVQYVIEYRHHRGEIVHEARIKRIAAILLIESAIVAASLAEYSITRTVYLSTAAIIFGMAATSLSGRHNCSSAVDFEHLSERAMLYVVFTFGEMIIAIASYFEGNMTPSSLYFSFMAFLIVVGLFLSYGVVYDKIVDRKMKTNGLTYMFIHIFIIFALNNITSALEFMRNDEVYLLPKIIFIVASMLIYFVFLFITRKFAKKRCSLNKRFYIIMLAMGLVFAALMLLFREVMAANIALTVVYVFAVFFILRGYSKKMSD